MVAWKDMMSVVLTVASWVVLWAGQWVVLTVVGTVAMRDVW